MSYEVTIEPERDRDEGVPIESVPASSAEQNWIFPKVQLTEILKRLPSDYQKMLQFFATYKGDDWQREYAKLMRINRNTLRNQFSRALTHVEREMTNQIRQVEAQAPDAAPSDRRVRVWFEGVMDRFWVHDTYRMGVVIVGSSGAEARGTVAPPGWGDVQRAELLITVSGHDITATPDTLRATLPAVGDMEPIRFDLRLDRGGRIAFFITVWTGRSLKLMQKLRVVLPVVKYRDDL